MATSREHAKCKTIAFTATGTTGSNPVSRTFYFGDFVVSEPVFLPGIIKSETASAWLLKINDPTGTLRDESDGEDVNNWTYWFPKSQCELHEDGLEVPDWLWKKKLEGD